MDNFSPNLIDNNAKGTKYTYLVVIILIVLIVLIIVGWRIHQRRKILLSLGQGVATLDNSLTDQTSDYNQPIVETPAADAGGDNNSNLNKNNDEVKILGLNSYKDISYGSDKNQKFDVYVPKGNRTEWPLIIFIHGGGGVAGDKRMLAPIATWLAKQGFVVMNINYRLMPTYTYPVQLEDIQIILQWTQKNADQYEIDINHIGISGHSAGSHLAALYALTQDKDYIPNGSKLPKVEAAAPISGGYTLEATEGDSSSAQNNRMWLSTADPQSLGVVVEQVDSGDRGVTFLIIQGDADTTALPSEARDFYSALVAAGVPAELAMYPGRTHSTILIGIPKNDVVGQKISSFFKENLK